MDILLLIVLGAFVGWIASLVMNRDAEQGAVYNIVVGVVGAFLGGFISNLVLGRDDSALSFDFSSLFWAFVGAVVLCAVINLITKKRIR